MTHDEELIRKTIEVCAKMCEKAARTYRAMKTDEDGEITIDAKDAEEHARCCELNARDIRSISPASVLKDEK